MSTPAVESLTDRASLSLLEYGYKPIDSHNGISTGSRVRNISHRYPDAYDKGTATVVAIFEKSPSAWSSSSGSRDIEIVIEADDKAWGHTFRAWASYGTVLVTPI